MNKLIYPGIGLLAIGAVGIIISIVMEITTGEPIYFTVMKATAMCFGVGGALIGISSIARRGKKVKGEVAREK